ncbi:hypothetical protein DTO166G4_1596 [Paecilomyces variotii]|nr:hypothetical protein DTO032I3_7398 [Paecilomyces variotii]KAJ9198102.1 hypothetical protein DTO164E3_5358 [Paecilomyces variotii]KAJ9216750.1 hypothetical protein DTO166G4_1596 [Paecilomyces variotii]KAJ9229689.1 hypothetical protein DTO169E5_8763 [Paecilomyces variotii]KAJ9232300.1 hypothetical protein DTO166G5_6277 [Paecilomyces variotii]
MEAELVKAAHLVPKSLTGEETSYIFGVDEFIRFDPRNGITLNKKIEAALDNGTIVIIPVPGTTTKWKCILVDEKLRKETCVTLRGQVKWEELDNKGLAFLTQNHPQDATYDVDHTPVCCGSHLMVRATPRS